MTESDKERAERVGDSKVTAAYRSLGAEEPPRALDEAILAAARRPRISPARTWTQRWALPLSLAAVVVLSVTVTLQMQLEQPGIDGLQAPPPAEQARIESQPQALKRKPEDQRKLPAKPQVKTEARRAEPKAFADAKPERARESVASSAPAPAVAGGLSSRSDTGRSEDVRQGDSALRREEERGARDAEAAARAPQVGAALAKRPAPETTSRAAAAPLERELERIAQLRAEGKHDEADKALAEFRKRHPDYRIAEDLLRRVERR